MKNVRISLTVDRHQDFVVAKNSLGLNWDQFFEFAGIAAIALDRMNDDEFKEYIEVIKRTVIRETEENETDV